MAMNIDELKSNAGRLLYRHLPEEYRYRDRPGTDEFGDLEAFLHGFGSLLDLIRGTLEQSYADGFAETADNGRQIQTWLLPYLAELVGAELLSPSPAVRREELNKAVYWVKTKGSLIGVDSVADTMSGAEAVVLEGWRRTLIAPRVTVPPFTGPKDMIGDGTPDDAPALPLGCPDFRFVSRAVEDEGGANPLYRREIRSRDPATGRLPAEPELVHWRPLSREGVPCFANTYDDPTVCTPDLRDPALGPVGPHPKRTIVHVRPSSGRFEAGLREETVADSSAIAAAFDDAALATELGPSGLLEALGLELDEELDRLVINGDLSVPAGAIWAFHDILFTGEIELESGARLLLRRGAVRRVVLPAPGDMPSLVAHDSLIGEIAAGAGFAELVHVTVLGAASLVRLHASDSIFNGPLEGITCESGPSCVRYSRVPSLAALEIEHEGGDEAEGSNTCRIGNSLSNTEADPNFISLFFDDGGTCVMRPANFGEPGAGVLDLTSSAAVREGAENGGEMGAHNHQFHASTMRALRQKLGRFAPFGQELSLIYDPSLSRPPARLQ